jgi:hypothetical protein
MRLTLPASLIATTLFLSTTIAAPTRTHCRCTIAADADPRSSAAHWTPAESKSAATDFCSNLGPELENSRYTEPSVYDTYLRGKGQPDVLTVKVLANFATRKDTGRTEGDKEPRPVSRPYQHIVCRAEQDPLTEYQGSFITLWALQIMVIIAILACLAEGLHLSLRWYGTPSRTTQGDWASGIMQLPGSEELVFEFLGSEKTERTSDATPILIVQTPNGDRVCISYEDEDDEMDRPVM